jgi:hypothetical protein
MELNGLLLLLGTVVVDDVDLLNLANSKPAANGSFLL